MEVKFQGQQPKKGRSKDVAYDTYTAKDVLVVAGGVGSTKIPLGFKTEFDADKYGMYLAPRGSFSKLPLAQTNSVGIIEGTYRGEWLAVVRAPLLGSGVSKRVITLGDDGKVTTIEVSELPKEALEDARKEFMKDLAIMNDLLDSTVPQGVLEELFVTYVPTGSVFIPKGSRLFQVFALEKQEIEWVESEELSDSERGSGNLGSSGTK